MVRDMSLAIILFEDDQQTVQVNTGQSLYEICDEFPSSLLFGCREGTCGTCLIRVSEGLKNLSAIQSDEQDMLDILAPDEENVRLACQCIVQGHVSLSKA